MKSVVELSAINAFSEKVFPLAWIKLPSVISPNSLRTPSAGDDMTFLSEDIGLNPSFNSLMKKLLKEEYLLISLSLASLISILNF